MAVIIWGTEQTADGKNDNASWSFGVGTDRGGTAANRCYCLYDGDASNACDGSERMSATAIINFVDLDDSTITCAASLVSFASDNFIINWTDLPDVASTQFFYMVIGGSDVTDALCFDFNLGGTSPQDVTVASGFGQPDLLLLFGPAFEVFGSLGPPTIDEEINFSLGWGIKDGAQRAFCFLDDAGSGTMDVGFWQQDGIALGIDNADPSIEDIEVSLAASSGWPTDGFELTLTNSPAATIDYCGLALRGTFNAAISARNTRTATGDDDYDVGFVPEGAFCWGGSLPSGATPNTTHASLIQWWVSAFDGTNQRYKGLWIDDNQPTSNTAMQQRSDTTVAVYTPDILLEADASFTGTIFRLNYSDIDATAREYNVLVLGAAETGTVAISAATEADTAQSLGIKHAIIQATEVETAQALTRIVTTDLVQATETDVAQTLSIKHGITQALETETAQSLGHVRAIALATETDTAQNLSVTYGLVQATETDLAQILGISLGLGLATETELAQTLGTGGETVAIVGAEETDASQALEADLTLAIAAATEADLAQSLGIDFEIAAATEADLAQALNTVLLLTLAIGQTSEADTAQSLGIVHTIIQSTETDLAQELAVGTGATAISAALETDEAMALTSLGGTRFEEQLFEWLYNYY